MKPMFIVIEGIDRIGKNTQADRLVEWLRSRGEMTSSFTTPDYKSASGALAGLFLKGEVRLMEEISRGDSVDLVRSTHNGLAYECTAMVDRYAVASKVKEALARGEHAICVRWWQSALVYGMLEGISSEWIRQACSFLPVPDLCVLLDVEEPSSRLDPSSRYETRRMQKEARESYIRLWVQESIHDDKSYWSVVNASRTPSEVAKTLQDLASQERGELRLQRGRKS
jgi:dTMP kinase